MNETRDLGFLKWRDEYAKYEDVNSELFKIAVKKENDLYNTAIKSISEKKRDQWTEEFEALPKAYEIYFSYFWLKYQINIRPDNRYIPTIEITVKNNKTHTFKDVTNYGNTNSRFWIIAAATKRDDYLSLFIYDEHFTLLKEIEHVGESAKSTDTEIFYLEAKNVFWSNKLYTITNTLEITKIYEESEEKYTLRLYKQKHCKDLFLLRHSAIYQDVAIIKNSILNWIEKGYGTKIPVTETIIAYNDYFVNNKQHIRYPKNHYLENVFLIEKK
jgi:hypothetical protein